MEMFTELGMRRPILSEDEDTENSLLRSLDRFGDRMVNDHDMVVPTVRAVYYFEPKVRRRLRYQAAILRS